MTFKEGVDVEGFTYDWFKIERNTEVRRETGRLFEIVHRARQRNVHKSVGRHFEYSGHFIFADYATSGTVGA